MTTLPDTSLKAWRPPMGWNSWDSYGTTITEDEVLANARFMAEHLKAAGWDTLVIDAGWFDPNAHAHGYSDGTPLCIDEYGRQLPDERRFPSSAEGKGFGPLADAVHELGLKLGVHVMRGIPRQAVHENLPVKDTDLTARDVADTEHNCVWNHDNYGLKRGDAGAQAWYDAQVDLFASWGLDFLKVDDMQTPFFPEEIEAYHNAIAKAEKRYGRRTRSRCRRAAGWPARMSIFCETLRRCGAFPTICGIGGKTFSSNSLAWHVGHRCNGPAIGPMPTCCRSVISDCVPNAATTGSHG